ERTRPVVVGDAREPPDVAQAHGRADRGEDEDTLPAPLLARFRALGGHAIGGHPDLRRVCVTFRARYQAGAAPGRGAAAASIESGNRVRAQESATRLVAAIFAFSSAMSACTVSLYCRMRAFRSSMVDAPSSTSSEASRTMS